MTLPPGTNVYEYTNTNSIAGCYYVTATDSAGNVSGTSLTVCAETCPDYVLPNVFTPDGNGINDTFHPFLPYRDVKDVDMKIYNRWGDLVFKTTDPMIRWNGKRNNTGDDNPEGTYFYICQVNEYSLDTVKPRMLHGTILLSRGEGTK
jgi:gliding motility-associated-like protein